MMGVDPETGAELTDEQMQMVWDVIDEEEEERARAEDMRMMESRKLSKRRLSKRQLIRIIREEKEKIDEEIDEQDEGNAFTGALADAWEKEEETFKVGKKTYDVKESRKITKSQLKKIIRESMIEAEATDLYDQLLDILDGQVRISLPEAADMLGVDVNELAMMVSSPAMSELEIVGSGIIQRVSDRYDDFEATNPEPSIGSGPSPVHTNRVDRWNY